MLSLDQESDQDDEDASDMDPDTDSVHDGNELHQEGVDQSVNDEEQEVDQDHLPALVNPARRQRDDRAQQQRQSEINAGSASKLTKQVPPSSDPCKERSVFSCQSTAVKVESTT